MHYIVEGSIPAPSSPLLFLAMGTGDEEFTMLLVTDRAISARAHAYNLFRGDVVFFQRSLLPENKKLL